MINKQLAQKTNPEATTILYGEIERQNAKIVPGKFTVQTI
jgi:hypothetical protein